MKKSQNNSFTTGTCAAAAAKAACYRLNYGKWLKSVSTTTPSGIKATLSVQNRLSRNGIARCSTTKPPNNDPDITAGIKIFATADITNNKTIEIIGGEGVGIITKPGLSIPVGNHAINPIPTQMIRSEIEKIFPSKHGIRITISIPEGEKLAKKTFNPRLGIKGGLSILGTTGIVKSMSDTAIKVSIVSQIDIAKALGFNHLALVPGSIGKNGAINLGFKDDSIVICSNFIGYILKQCAKKKIEEVSVVSHLGKLLKLLDGKFNTHHKSAKLNFSLLAAFLSKKEIKNLNTAEQATQLLLKKNKNYLSEIAKQINEKIACYTKHKLKVNTHIIDMKSRIVGSYAK